MFEYESLFEIYLEYLSISFKEVIFTSGMHLQVKKCFVLSTFRFLDSFVVFEQVAMSVTTFVSIDDRRCADGSHL